MRLTKVSGIDGAGREIDDLAEAIETEINSRALDLNKEWPNAVLLSVSIHEIRQGILITLLYEV